MLFMNEYEIDEAVRRYAPDTTQGRGARFLAAYRDEVNAHSDGWPYWSAPVRAAAKLMRLLTWKREQANDVTETELHKALTPIKSFYTRRGYAAGMKFPEVGIL